MTPAPEVTPGRAGGTGYLITPRVLAATSKLLLLEALAPCADGERSWEGFARDLAAAHILAPFYPR